MRLQIGPSIDNNKVRLDFRKSPDRPDNPPSYQIDSTKADEFVNRYNSQSKNLNKFTLITVSVLTVLGFAAGMLKRSIVGSFAGIAGGILAGLSLGAAYSSYRKNSLMDKYDVKEISQNQF